MDKKIARGRDNLKSKNAGAPRKKKQTPVSREIEAYLTSGEELYSLLKLASAFEALGIPAQAVKRVTKEAIRENIALHNPSFDSYSLFLHTNLQDLISSFDASDFIERAWQYMPMILHNREYLFLHEQEKYPIFVDKYNYDEPLYKFSNNINFQNETTFKRRKIQNSNDVQFYTNKDEKMIFAKVTNINFAPISHRLIKQVKKTLNEDDQKRIIYSPELYNRTFSISYYVMLDGDPKRCHSFLRYDSAVEPHKNVFFKGDQREEVYGAIAKNPHFHFQNEDDGLLCIKKYRDNDRHIRWKTGRCNAIDCEHLINYLQSLDKKSTSEIESLFYNGKHYNMPFLKMKLLGRKVELPTVDNLLKKFLSKKEEGEGKFIDCLNREFNEKVTKGKTAGCFSKLITTLELLNFITTKRAKTDKLSELEILSNLEVEAASEVVNAISHTHHKILEKDYKPKYVIDGGFICREQSANDRTEEVTEDIEFIDCEDSEVEDENQ